MVLVTAIFGSDALAQSKATDPACLTQPVEGQKLRRAGKLVEARGRFETCSRNTCPAQIVKDCMRWRGELDEAIPGVVVVARDAQGHDVVDVRASVDGKDVVAVTTTPIQVDPGEHRFVFHRDGSPDVARVAFLREGERHRELSVTFGSPSAPESETTSTAPALAPRPVPASVWAFGAIGVVGLASFGTFAALGASERASSHCDTGCPQAEKSSVDTKLLVADISLGVGAAALVAAGILYLTRPSQASPQTGLTFDLTPLPGGGGSALVRGRF